MPRKIVDFDSLNTGDVFWHKALGDTKYRKFMVIFHPNADFLYTAVQILGKHKGSLALFSSWEKVEVIA